MTKAKAKKKIKRPARKPKLTYLNIYSDGGVYGYPTAALAEATQSPGMVARIVLRGKFIIMKGQLIELF